MTRLNLALGLLAAVFFALSLLTGPAAYGPLDSLRALVAGGDEAAMIVMREIRLPRASASCGGPFVVEAVTALAAARRKLASCPADISQ